MATTTVYRKTDAGAAALGDRRSGLPPRQRMLLIMVDGQRTVEELRRLGSSVEEADALMADLVQRGLIEARVQQRAADEGQEPGHGVPLQDAQRRAVRALTDLMGPASTDLCLRLEASRTREEFRAAVKRAEAVLRETFGPQKAALFVGKVENP